MSNHEILVRIFEIFVEITTHVLGSVRGWEWNTPIPLTDLGTKKIFINFILDYSLYLLNVAAHMSLSIEKSMLRAVIDLSVFNTSNSFGCAMEASLAKGAPSHDILACTSKSSSWKISFFLILNKE